MKFRVRTQQPLLKNSLYTDKDVDSLSKQKLELERYLQDTKHRKTFAWWIMWLDSIFLVLVLTIIVLCGLRVLFLPASVLNTLLATTTIEVIGLAYIILHGLFDTKYSIKKK